MHGYWWPAGIVLTALVIAAAGFAAGSTEEAPPMSTVEARLDAIERQLQGIAEKQHQQNVRDAQLWRLLLDRLGVRHRGIIDPGDVPIRGALPPVGDSEPTPIEVDDE